MNRLRLQLALRRHGPLPWVALALALAALAIDALLLPQVQARATAATTAAADIGRRIVQAGVRETTVAGPSREAQRLAAFEALLPPAAGATRGIEAVLERAAKGALPVAQAEYKWGAEPAGGYRTLEMLLPLKSPYPQVRRLVDEVLVALPNAALDEAAFRREGVAAAPEARLRFTLFVRGEGP